MILEVCSFTNWSIESSEWFLFIQHSEVFKWKPSSHCYHPTIYQYSCTTGKWYKCKNT